MNRIINNLLKYKYFYIMIFPVIAWYIIFCYIPMYGIITAFQDYNMNKGNFGSEFVGLKHFLILFKDADFWGAFRNNVIIAFYRLVTAFPIPIILALILNEVKGLKFKKTVQTVIYLPHFISWVIVASVVIVVLNTENGLIATLYNAMGKEVPYIMSDPKAFRSVLIWSDIWKEAGWGTIIYMAAIAGIDVSLYEAAIVDGAGRWKQMWHITLSGIRNVVVIMLILTVGSILNWGFDQVYNLYNPLVYETGDIIDTYIFRTALADNKLSYAAAAGLFKSLLCVVLLVGSNKIANLLNEEGIY